MNFEHIGLRVPEPQAMAEWYAQHLGFSFIRRAGDNADGVAFITDPSGSIVFELFALPDLAPLDPRPILPLQFHIAYATDDAEAAMDRLIKAGATFAGRPERQGPGDNMILLRDPWGFVIQLAQRADKAFLARKE